MDHVSEATAIVDAGPEEVYAVVTDYEHWPEIFSDVRWVKVEGGSRHDARVRFRSRVLEHDVTVQFDNEPNRLIRFEGVQGPPGGRASGSYLLTSLDDGARTEVRASLYLDVVGIPSLLVRDAKIRSMREAKLRADLGDAVRVCGHHVH